MQPRSAWWRVLWPRQLMRQVLVVAAGVILVSGALYSLVADRGIGKLGRHSLQNQAAALAHSVASGGALHLVTGDAAALEKLLMTSAAYPGVRWIVVADEAGRVKAAVRPDAAGNIRADFDLRSIDLPSAAELGHGRLVERNGDALIEAYAAIDNGVRLGWVRASIGVESERAVSAAARNDALLSAIGISLVTLTVLYVFFGRALRPLSHCARFASQLGAHPGSTLQVQGRNSEIDELAGALNSASHELQAKVEALAEHSARIDAVFAMSPDGFVLFEHPGRLVAVNRAFAAMIGISQDELMGSSVQDFDRLVSTRCDPQQPYAALDVFERAQDVAPAPPEPAQLITLLRPERRVLQRHARLTEGGRKLVLYYHDITRESEVDRMKSEFLSTAAHELRTPMASIYGFTELLLKRRYSEERQQEFLETIYRQTGRVVNLVNELLDLARIEARAGVDFKIASLSLAPIVRETAAALRQTDAARTTEIDVPDDLPCAAADPDKLRQALINVIGNAYKYSPQGGAVRVSTLQGIDAGRRQVGIRVEDHGIGMTPEQVARAFERFYRADTSGHSPGTGLGLCLVKEIIELQGGRVELCSEIGIGTRVTLWLPVAAAGQRVAA